ncbi:CHASE2 domain-containing protein [Sphingorhabdus pulchriflava]|uniref:histidine kinase n=1 Tax=Sphingorhabdus pulchriflava TaxID=2292257 RepID=A0A371BFT5_9SPHN|nr:CHASE2 domain-containing protein [Sphingorhabdus pulchriflava]RDV06462.1 CHASE2 domain-containing protein [Sphingorhabdus pulchriflava]
MLGHLRFRLLLEWAVIAILGTLAVLAASNWRGTASFDNLLFDRLSTLSRPPADQNILIVTIDERSLKALGKWPWPRKYHAELLTKVDEAKPRSILLDLLLSEPSNEQDDSALAQAMRGSTPVYLPANFPTPGDDGRNYDIESPFPMLSKEAEGVGHVNVEFDEDGIVRRTSLCFKPEPDGRNWPHITELVYRLTGNPSPAAKRSRSCDERLLVRYSARRSFAEISYVDALMNGIPADLVKGRDIIIGATAAGMGDNYPGPFADGGLISGAEIMANVLASIRRDDFITQVGRSAGLILSLLPVWVLMIGFLRWQPRTALIVSLSLVGFVLSASSLALFGGYWFPPGAALLGMLLVYPLWGWRRLQAMSDFMASELGDLALESEALPLPLSNDRTSDLVGRQSAALATAIDHVRDLRRFVSDSLEHLPDPMFVSDNSGIVTLANHRIEDLLGSDLKGQTRAALLDRLVAPQHRSFVEAYLWARAHGRDADTEYVRFGSPGGSTFVMRSADIRNDADSKQGEIHYLADISALAQAETDREQALQLLSHDMRAPQSAIISMLPAIPDRDMGHRIERHARRTIQLAQDFVDIARMGESAFEGQDVLLADLVRDVADSLWPLAEERQIKIDITDSSNSGFVIAEPDSLTRAITNLLDNAIKYSPTPGKIIARIEHAHFAGSKALAVVIHDQGKGIDPDLLPDIFKRFAARAREGSRIKSSGLGLAYVKAVALRHGGSIEAENPEQGGALFRLTLPKASDVSQNLDA